MLAQLVLLTLLASAPNAQAQHVTIVRDDWGIAHVHGKTDADAVFGMVYAQAEDDFNRVETNYLTSLGWLAQADGESAVYKDLRQRLFVDPTDLQARYRTAPAWLRTLMDAWANGLNYFLATHPNVHPRVITHFEPWMTLSFSEGSIGGDIERVNLDALAAFYGGTHVAASTYDANAVPVDPQGSNGIAIAPSNTQNHRALLLINPHTSYYFRSELQMTSDEGLNAYGAATWGQFFIYQGFNPHCGWMHTSTGADNVDQFAESIVQQNGSTYYRYGTQLRPVTVSQVQIPYRRVDGTTGTKSFTVYRTHHGPIVAQRDGKWLAEALMYRPVEALEQSFLRTKATDFASFRRIAELRANSSNNTIFADGAGEIAYLHPQFMPRREDRFDYTKPVDGADPATDWNRLHALDELPHVVNPSTGFVFNTNNWPYSAAGADSPKQRDYPRYMDTVGETPRGEHALALLEARKDFTIERLREAAFDTDLPPFHVLVPSLVQAYDRIAAGDYLKAKLQAPVETLREWNFRWAPGSNATSLAVLWAEALARVASSSKTQALLALSDRDKLANLATVVDKLNADFGTWQTPWGAINRFQRANDEIDPHFDDALPSIPIDFTAGTWGSLAACYSPPTANTKRRYCRSGNSFVAIVEFGKRVRAIAITAGGESGHPGARHFNDEAQRYANGDLREVYFYPDQLQGHIERRYHPGD